MIPTRTSTLYLAPGHLWLTILDIQHYGIQNLICKTFFSLSPPLRPTIESDHLQNSVFRQPFCQNSDKGGKLYIMSEKDESQEDTENEKTQKDEELIGLNENTQEIQETVDFMVQDDACTSSFGMKLKKKKALLEFRCRVEDAILGNYILGKTSNKLSAKSKRKLREITLWGVPLLPSKGHEGTDIVLMKFLKEKDFKVSEAFEMLRNTLKWRKEYKIDKILDEKLDSEFGNLLYLKGMDREGHPLYYSVDGASKDKELHGKAYGTEENRDEFLRWRVQLMEKGIKHLEFKEGGVNSIVQIIDLKNVTGTGAKEFSSVSKKAIMLFQNNYPGLIHKNILVNVPFWFYTSHVLLSRFMNQKTKRKFVFARPSKVTQTLLKYIAPEYLSVEYGGLNRENDDDFTPADKASDLIIRANTVASIEFPVNEPGVTMVWDVGVVGWEVSYKEEFIPNDDGSYTILLQNQKKMGESIRNSFYISEPGKIVITIENGTFKKKIVSYRFKAKPTIPIYILLKPNPVL
ncbi:patellin-4-like [Quillaja saponaria]|uniref:Patellin-4-like n=1 Tax=Quillaja saponaria TaxID=32244 RepID=A0AAD7Q9M3_QUISA|nr:patellin-4-like [Quillaja saponaria]